MPRTPNLLTPVAMKMGGISWMPRLLPQITWTDKTLQRLTDGHWSLLRVTGLPNLMLTVVGCKSGIERQTPLLCVPYRDGHLIAGSNFGGAKSPMWVANVRAAETVGVRINAVSHRATPHELTGPEREAAWQTMLSTWPNYAQYAERTDRTIPVFLLEPVA